MAIANPSQSPMFRRWADRGERPSTRASSILQMWRELEGERPMSDSCRYTKKTRNGSDFSCSSSLTSLGKGSDDGDDISEDSDECPNQSEPEDDTSVVSEQSSDLGNMEREKVKQVFLEWKDNGLKSHSVTNGLNSDKRPGPEPERLGENEHGRVRMIREWVETNLQQRSCWSPRNGNFPTNSQFKQISRGVNPGTGLEPKSIRRLCGRQTLMDLLAQARCERQRELQRLSEKKPVSDFAHRNRIQALLRGRFLRNDRLVSNEKRHCIAANELRLLRQRGTVSDLREGFLPRLDNSTLSSANGSVSDPYLIAEKNGQTEAAYSEKKSCWESVSDDIESLLEFETGDDGNQEDSNEPFEALNGQDQSQVEACVVFEAINCSDKTGDNAKEGFRLEDAPTPLDKVQESVTEPENGSRDDTSRSCLEDSAYQLEMQEAHEVLDGHDLQDTIDSWLEIPSLSVCPSNEAIDSLYFSEDDDNVYAIERRELFRRRRVSSLLQSSFREKLNQVLQSHAERLGRVSDDLEEESLSSSPILIEQEQVRHGGISPSTSNHNSETEWKVINALRIDMEALRQRMNDIQGMLEECMDLQIELQRSMQPTLSRAFSPTDAPEQNLFHDDSHWNYMKRGICCLCHDNKIDSLLYRCGHMCTCSACSDELIHEVGKCPICQTPVAEAVQAYFIP